jgi:small GTP-binding protein
MKDQYIRNSNGFLLLYDVTGNNALEEIQTDIDKIMRIKDEESVSMVLIGTKCDLEKDRKIKSEEGMEFAKKNDIQLFETSAKLNINIEEAIYALIDDIYKKGWVPNIPTTNSKNQKDCYTM